ncbi:MAG: hypothetical protein KDM64_18095, partial [Verrucomicrobiae bacterium]|nr:hypothetical protein [Verrucomicrobiae bacterium]
MKGVLGDGVKFSEVAYLSADQEASLYAEPYASKPEPGRVGGRVVFRDQAGVSDFDGKLQWRKFPNPKASRYRDGFDVEGWALGSRYEAPVAGQRVLAQLADQHYNAELTLIGATAPLAEADATSRVLSWLSNNRLVHYGPQQLSGVATAKSGAVTGTFLDPASKAKVAFSGVAFQKQGLVGGVFVRGEASGAVRIKPGTAYAYPGSEAAGATMRLKGPEEGADEPVEGAVAFVPEAAGLYGGILIRKGDGVAGSGALESLKVLSTGAISGVLWVEGVRLPFKGKLFADGSTQIRIVRKNGSAVVMTLQLVKIDEALTEPDDGFGFGGTLSLDDGATVAHTIDVQRKPSFTKGDRAPQEGGYTLAMRAPDGVDGLVEPGGDGYGTMRVSYSGMCTGLVVLAEGTRVSLGG